jgi:hypothetical protein
MTVRADPDVRLAYNHDIGKQHRDIGEFVGDWILTGVETRDDGLGEDLQEELLGFVLFRLERLSGLAGILPHPKNRCANEQYVYVGGQETDGDQKRLGFKMNTEAEQQRPDQQPGRNHSDTLDLQPPPAKRDGIERNGQEHSGNRPQPEFQCNEQQPTQKIVCQDIERFGTITGTCTARDLEQDVRPDQSEANHEPALRAGIID